MAIFDVLCPKTEMFRSYFLEASAGTGKTFAIENIVPRLLLESKDPQISLEEILVVTFTRAATRELKTRIYQNLLNVKEALEKKEGGPRYLEPLQKGSDADLREAKRRIEEALCFFDRAEVFTLHGFCLKILQEFAFESKFLLSSSDEQECAQKDRLKEYIRDFLRRGMDSSILSHAQLKRVIKETGSEIHTLVEAILQRLEGRVKIRSYPTACQSHRKWNEALQKLPRALKEKLFQDFQKIAPRLANSKKRKQQVDAFFNAVEEGSCSFESWDRLLVDEELFLEAMNFSSFYQKVEKGPVSLHYPGLFETMQEVFVPLYKSAIDFGTLILVLSKAALAHYEKGREDLAHFNPDDLVFLLEESIKKNSQFCQKLRSKYKAAIIDEFQDTDPLQWGIFEKLFLQEERLKTLYLVGDPKQSIYAFRRADVYLYLKAASLLGEKAVAYLDTNYRSHPHLVEALNEVFSFNLPSSWMLLPFLNTSLDVRRVSSKPIYESPLDHDELGRVHFFCAVDEALKEKKWPREEVEEKKLFPFIAKEIPRLRKDHGYSFQQMAVLVKDRYQAVRLQQFLKARGIDCLMQKSLDVSKSVAYSGLKDLLLSITKPSSLSYLKRFLGSALIGLASSEVEGTLENPHLQRAKEFMIEVGSLLRKKGLGVLFEYLLSSSFQKDKKTVVEHLLSQEDPSLYFDLRQLIQILLEHCPEGAYEAHKLLSFLENLSQLPKDSEVLRQFSEEEEDQVQVMTAHRSKGLEFEIVFALGLCSRYLREEVCIPLRENEEMEMVASLQESTALEMHLQEMDAEKLRQLYVALTRAKERIYIPVVFSKNPQKPSQGAAAPIELLLGGIGLSEYTLESVYQTIQEGSFEKMRSYFEDLRKRVRVSYELLEDVSLEIDIQKQEGIELIPPPVLNVRSNARDLLSFSSLSSNSKEKKEIVELPTPPNDQDSFHSLPLGAETGTVIHAILEELCKADLHRSLNHVAKRVIENRCKGSCLEGRESTLFELMQKIMKMTMILQGQETSLEKIPAFDLQTEVEFLYPFESSLVKGFIDLVFRFQGKYYILDWKTNYLGPQDEDYSTASMKEAMQKNNYFLQGRIYSVALQKYLSLFEKKPLLGGVIYVFLRGVSSYIFEANGNDLTPGDIE